MKKKMYFLLVILALMSGLLFRPTMGALAAVGDWSVGFPVVALDVYSGFADYTHDVYLVGGQNNTYVSSDETNFSLAFDMRSNAFSYDGTYYWAATGNDGIYRSSDGDTWADANGGGSGDGNVMNGVLAISGVVFAGNLTDDTVLCSTNSGSSWSTVLSVNNPRNLRLGEDGMLYIAADGGMYRTSVTASSCTVSFQQSTTSGVTWSTGYDIYETEFVPGTPVYFVASEDGVFINTGGWTAGAYSTSWGTQATFTIENWVDDGIVVGTNTSGVITYNPAAQTWSVLDPNSTMELLRVNELAPIITSPFGYDGYDGYEFAFGHDNANTVYGAWKFDSENSTAVTLSDFSVSEYWNDETDAGMNIHWETSMEQLNIGFNLYHALDGEAELTDLGFIDGNNYPSEYDFYQNYAFSGAPICPGTNYWWLEDIDAYVGPSLHGPIDYDVPNGLESITTIELTESSATVSWLTNNESFYSGNITFGLAAHSSGECPAPNTQNYWWAPSRTNLSHPLEALGDSYPFTFSMFGYDARCAVAKVTLYDQRCIDVNGSDTIYFGPVLISDQY
ncbi:hypothetical protein A3K34_04855 [candidate division WWE3 bacterium RIFOXYC1_FULL_40_10]|nr:MAG: hypothetical protein A3K58_04855 [candidate division WWE3 bacterium RIFOXYB1_FULL_40_22]OGC62167.1 MAG: hypothetical protein A3K37_04855 [candidate division WWE3 bacterium RIFOXYA1_FULL_40_11]OGC65261.1 MAG: hypothetical protein A2326_04240 [candidate division WWE3 bacterium RIFOXYB2_FULL_41_6]OGC66550.1 MAG: hypothetical protein A3K34_04855 [candidate division WWE3 bacterium RIFOXYC1_FULL_40_10]OGC67700.1 MAG: hypothetical protein A2450_02765 [candidate division WWE3 bacterium RIFOXYC2